jgi:hypothetical protein
MAAAAAPEDQSKAGKGRAWKRRRNGLPKKKSAIGVEWGKGSFGLERSWIDGIENLKLQRS